MLSLWTNSGSASIAAAGLLFAREKRLLRPAYILLGAGYALLAVGVLVAGARRHQQVNAALGS